MAQAEAVQEAKDEEKKEGDGKKYYPLNGDTEDAVVIHCSDPEFQEAFRRFIAEELQIGHPAPIVIPGSISAVGIDFAMPKQLKTLKDQVMLLLDKKGEQRLVIINHESCHAYQKIRSMLSTAFGIKQEDDLKKAAVVFKKLVPALERVEMYMARVDRQRPVEEQVYFEKLF